MLKESETEFHFSWGRNKNKGGGDSCSLSKCYLKGIPKNTIGGIRGSISDNLIEALSIFEQVET